MPTRTDAPNAHTKFATLGTIRLLGSIVQLSAE